MRHLPLLALPLAAAAVLAPVPAVSGTSESHALPPSAAAPRVGAHYAFAAVLGGRPVRWDPCTPIRWTSSTGRGPGGGLAVLKAAVARTAQLTGTRWVYAGERPGAPRSSLLPTRAAPTYPPVHIGWADGPTSDLLRGKPRSVLGVTRTAWFGRRDAAGRPVAAIRAAVVALDRSDRLPLRGAGSWHATAMHELGHVVGLEHPSDSSQLMAARLPRGAGDWQGGDVAGLRAVGRGAGCVHVP